MRCILRIIANILLDRVRIFSQLSPESFGPYPVKAMEEFCGATPFFDLRIFAPPLCSIMSFYSGEISMLFSWIYPGPEPIMTDSHELKSRTQPRTQLSRTHSTNGISFSL